MVKTIWGEALVRKRWTPAHVHDHRLEIFAFHHDHLAWQSEDAHSHAIQPEQIARRPGRLAEELTRDLRVGFCLGHLLDGVKQEVRCETSAEDGEEEERVRGFRQERNEGVGGFEDLEVGWWISVVLICH